MFSALFTLFAQFPDQPQPGADVDLGPIPAIILGIQLVLVVLLVASFWKIFTKAGQPGWAAIIPIYNLVIFLKIVNRPVWWIILFIIPFVGFIMYLIALYDLSKSFGHDVGYFIGMMFLPFIFFPIIAFGDSKYRPITH